MPCPSLQTDAQTACLTESLQLANLVEIVENKWQVNKKQRKLRLKLSLTEKTFEHCYVKKLWFFNGCFSVYWYTNIHKCKNTCLYIKFSQATVSQHYSDTYNHFISRSHCLLPPLSQVFLLSWSQFHICKMCTYRKSASPHICRDIWTQAHTHQFKSPQAPRWPNQ